MPLLWPGRRRDRPCDTIQLGRPVPPLESGCCLSRLQPAQRCEGVAATAQVDSVEVVSVAEVVVVVGSSSNNLFDDNFRRMT